MTIESEGDANIQLASGSYNEWLAGQGLLMLSESEERYDLQMPVEDIGDANDDENETEKSQKQHGNENSNVKKYEYIKSGDVCNLDEITEEVQSMMLQQGSVEKSEKRKTRLELILQLLEEEKDEQSIDKQPAGMAIDGGGGMPSHKMSVTEDKKPPDGSSLEKPKSDDQKSLKPAGGSMLIHKMSGNEDNKPPDGSSPNLLVVAVCQFVKCQQLRIINLLMVVLVNLLVVAVCQFIKCQEMRIINLLMVVLETCWWWQYADS